MFVSSRWLLKKSLAPGSPVPGAFWIPSSWELQKGVVAARSVQCCQFLPCKSCFFLSVWCWSCSEAAPGLLWGSLLGDHSSQCSCSPVHPWELCRLAQCVLHVNAGWHSKPPLVTGPANRAWKDTQDALPAGCQRAEGFSEMLMALFLAELSEAWTPLWNQTLWCFRWGTQWCWFIYFAIRLSPLISSLSWGHEWEAARHGILLSAVGAVWCCVGITICTQASLWYKPHPLLFLIRSSLKYNILLVG